MIPGHLHFPHPTHLYAKYFFNSCIADMYVSFPFFKEPKEIFVPCTYLLPTRVADDFGLFLC
jgi:hypothetical protein